MRAHVVIDVTPSAGGTEYSLEIWDYDRESPVRPLYTLHWLTHDDTHVDGWTILSHARHVAYVAYSRIGQELEGQRQHMPIGLGLTGEPRPK